MRIRKRFILIFLFSLSCFQFAQKGEIHGVVLDNENQPIIGANVIVENTTLGTATDSEGRFKIVGLPSGKYNINISIIGYERKRSDEISINGNSIEINFILMPKSYQFDQLIITAGKYAQDMKRIPVSSYLIDQNLFSEKNIRQIDEALRYVPGITMTSDQLSIRGSSGYSRGAGTRVLVTIDGIPIYSPDSGDIIWELVPVTEIGRVEIIKGSASSLYGSSAIGGVINVLSKEISSNPITYIKLQNGIYANPSHDEWKWTDRTLSFNSQTISHSRSIGDLSLSGSFTRFEDYSYRQNDYQLRFAGFLKANYHFSESTSLILLGTGYTRDKGTFNYWNDVTRALSPPNADIGQTTDSDRTILGMTLNHIFNEKLSITFINSGYISFWKDDSDSRNKSDSRLIRSELRGNLSITDEIMLITGLEFQANKVSSNIFGNRNANGFGVYSQADYKPIEDLSLSFGLRYDFTQTEGIENSQALSPKIGINYELSPTTILRGLISKGFRAPTLAEAFTSTSASGIIVKPNPNIKSESSYSYEIGINHVFSEGLNMDLSIFNNEYFDMIEPGFDANDGQVFFDNVTRARILGIDGTSRINFIGNTSLSIGYTYLWARDLNEEKALNYRSRHTFQLGADYSQSIFQIGVNFRYHSRMENIDYEFVDLGIIPNGDKRVEIFVLDTNAGISLFQYNIPAKLFLKVNNLLNYNYVELIGNIAPIRNISLNLEVIL